MNIGDIINWFKELETTYKVFLIAGISVAIIAIISIIIATVVHVKRNNKKKKQQLLDQAEEKKQKEKEQREKEEKEERQQQQQQINRNLERIAQQNANLVNNQGQLMRNNINALNNNINIMTDKISETIESNNSKITESMNNLSESLKTFSENANNMQNIQNQQSQKGNQNQKNVETNETDEEIKKRVLSFQNNISADNQEIEMCHKKIYNLFHEEIRKKIFNNEIVNVKTMLGEADDILQQLTPEEKSKLESKLVVALLRLCEQKISQHANEVKQDVFLHYYNKKHNANLKINKLLNDDLECCFDDVEDANVPEERKLRDDAKLSITECKNIYLNFVDKVIVSDLNLKTGETKQQKAKQKILDAVISDDLWPKQNITSKILELCTENIRAINNKPISNNPKKSLFM